MSKGLSGHKYRFRDKCHQVLLSSTRVVMITNSDSIAGSFFITAETYKGKKKNAALLRSALFILCVTQNDVVSMMSVDLKFKVI